MHSFLALLLFFGGLVYTGLSLWLGLSVLINHDTGYWPAAKKLWLLGVANVVFSLIVERVFVKAFHEKNRLD